MLKWLLNRFWDSPITWELSLLPRTGHFRLKLPFTALLWESGIPSPKKPWLLLLGDGRLQVVQDVLMVMGMPCDFLHWCSRTWFHRLSFTACGGKVPIMGGQRAEEGKVSILLTFSFYFIQALGSWEVTVQIQDIPHPHFHWSFLEILPQTHRGSQWFFLHQAMKCVMNALQEYLYF